MTQSPKNIFQYELSEISDVILADEINFSDLSVSLTNLKTLFMKVSEIDPTLPEYKEDIHHETGKAIGPQWAGLCVDDLLRTKRFSKGTFHAIKEAEAKNPGKTVTLLYVGTGPFATLIMPLLTKFTPQELQLILVEVNPVTVTALKNTIKNLGVEAYVKEIISTDAAQLELENPSEIDILLLECLQFALVKEQQVAITYNMIPQLRNDVILVPEEIKLSVGMVNSIKKMEYMNGNSEVSFYKDINPVFVLSKDEILNRVSNSESLIFPEVITNLSEEDKANFTTTVISTDIKVFGDQLLGKDECSLTMSFKLNDNNKIMPYSAVTTLYEINENPGLKIEWI